MNQQLQTKKILVADDSPVVAKMLSNTLRAHGFEVIIASDGIEAVQAAYRELPALVVLDIFMPRMNGYQVCRLLKHDPAVSHIPVVINTASDQRSTEFWSHHTGADAFLMKGAAPADLLAIIERTLNLHAPMSAATAQVSPPQVPSAEEILSSLCALVDQELYQTTAKSLESQTILDNLCEGILIVDTRGRVSSANHFICHLTGVTQSVMQWRSLHEALGEAAGTTAEELFEKALTQQAASRDAEIVSRSGVVTPVSINVAPVHDYLGEIVGGVCLFQDITKRKQVEALNRLKNDLTDMIVHDLRTPLTSLLTGLMTVPALGDMNEDQLEFMNISVEGGQILLGMINDLLDISKMEDGSLLLERKPLLLSDMMERSMRQIASLAQAKGLLLKNQIAPDLPAFDADEDKLLRMMVNLLSNAIKFTPTGGTITVMAQFVLRPERRDSIVVTCVDTGEGIPREAFERIFEKFGQVETRTAGRKMSTGLGLTFCKMVAQAHGGRIWVESEPGKGTAFSVAIPTSAAKCGKAAAEQFMAAAP